MNKVILIGRLTRDPEVRVLSTGTAVANFSLAINRNFRNKEGNIDADFINITVYGRQVDVVQKYTSKGSQIGVEGRIQTRTYDAQDGSRRSVVEVVCDSVQFLESRQARDRNTQPQIDTSNQSFYNNNDSSNDFGSDFDNISNAFDIMDDDIQF